jgi:hypothetical protein
MQKFTTLTHFIPLFTTLLITFLTNERYSILKFYGGWIKFLTLKKEF